MGRQPHRDDMTRVFVRNRWFGVSMWPDPDGQGLHSTGRRLVARRDPLHSALRLPAGTLPRRDDAVAPFVVVASGVGFVLLVLAAERFLCLFGGGGEAN